MRIPIRLLLTLGMLLTAAVPGWAQLPPNVPLKWWNNPRAIQQIGLSQDQINKIEFIWRENRKTLIDLRAEHDKQQIDFDEMLTRENIDEAALAAKADQLYKAKAQVEKVTLVMRLRIRNVLTREQQERSVQLFNQLRQELQQRNQSDSEKAPAARNPNRGRIPPVRPPQ